MGLACRIARFELLEKGDSIAGTSHRASFVPARSRTSKRVIYFARKAEYCEGAEWAELCASHDLVGELFGYPSCCVRSFGKAPPNQFDRWPSSVRSAGPFPRILNPASFYVYGVPSLIFHFPCSLRCRRSIALAEARMVRLARLTGKPGLLARVGRGIALYGPKIGIGIISKYDRRGPNEYAIGTLDTRDALTRSCFSEAAIVRLVDGHTAYVDGRRISGRDQLVAEFE